MYYSHMNTQPAEAGGAPARNACPVPPPRGLIGVDFDGTLMRGGVVNPEDLAALKEAQSAGVPVIVATGRSHFAAEPSVADLGLKSPHASYDSAWIVTPTGERIRDLRIAPDIAREILRGCRDMDVAVRVFLPDRVVLTQDVQPDEVYFKYRPFEQVDPGIVDTLAEGPMQMVLVNLDDVRAFHKAFAGTRVEHELQWMLHGNDPETPHLWVLHVLNKGGKKGEGLAFLCDAWGIDPANTLTFGDGSNDVSMLQWSGSSVSFPWGSRLAQRAARTITELNDPHPIATWVRAWLKSDLAPLTESEAHAQVPRP